MSSGVAVVLDAQEEHDLVARALEVELELRVLVRAAARAHGGLPVLDQRGPSRSIALPRLSAQSWQNQSPTAARRSA